MSWGKRSANPYAQFTGSTGPKELDVHLILDNNANHKTPEIKRWLLRIPRFHLHFTPTSSFGELMASYLPEPDPRDPGSNIRVRTGDFQPLEPGSTAARRVDRAQRRASAPSHLLRNRRWLWRSCQRSPTPSAKGTVSGSPTAHGMTARSTVGPTTAEACG